MARREAREEMAGLVRQWRASGESAAAFCRRQGIKPQKFSYWKRVLGLAQPMRRRARRRSLSSLVPVQLVGASVGTNGRWLEIHLGNGEHVMFPEGGSVEVLREVLGLLRERC